MIWVGPADPKAPGERRRCDGRELRLILEFWPPELRGKM